jgi:dTDP-glucose 4,6-dehydratase
MPIMTRSPIKRVLLTGASGTLGYNTVHSLRALSPEVSLCLLMRQGDRDLFVGLPNVAIAQVDLADTEKLSAAVSEFQPNAIIHCAAAGVRPSKASYFDLVNLNVSATMNLFRASCDIEGCHFINISTGLVYGSRDLPCREIDPVNMRHPYGATKAAADCLLLAGAEQLDRELTMAATGCFRRYSEPHPSTNRSRCRQERNCGIFAQSRMSQTPSRCCWKMTSNPDGTYSTWAVVYRFQSAESSCRWSAN